MAGRNSSLAWSRCSTAQFEGIAHEVSVAIYLSEGELNDQQCNEALDFSLDSHCLQRSDIRLYL